ncbi:MAG: hypothetical protein ACR2HG_14655 [Pyrinomonadaceae bacterium]
MKKLELIIALGMILGLAGISFAQNGTRSINRRQARQERRIEQGAANSSLTPKETYRLEKQEARISELEAKDRASGGRLSLKERAELNRLLNSEDHRIYQQKHDAQGYNPNSANINQRQENQTNRIEQGVANGSLTPQETYRLERQEARISELEAKDRTSGGRLSASERAELNRLLNSESHRIYVQKHDGKKVNP